MESSDRSFKKKQEIADKFMEFFLRHGMVKTIVNDVSKELHMSKKTIYKYFKGGKQECLYFIFSKVGQQARLIVEKDICAEVRGNIVDEEKHECATCLICGKPASCSVYLANSY